MRLPPAASCHELPVVIVATQLWSHASTIKISLESSPRSPGRSMFSLPDQTFMQ